MCCSRWAEPFFCNQQFCACSSCKAFACNACNLHRCRRRRWHPCTEPYCSDFPNPPAPSPTAAAQAAERAGADHRGARAHHQVQAAVWWVAVAPCSFACATESGLPGCPIIGGAVAAWWVAHHAQTDLFGVARPPLRPPLRRSFRGPACLQAGASCAMLTRAIFSAPHRTAGGGLAADISLGAENGAHAVDFVRRQVREGWLHVYAAWQGLTSTCPCNPARPLPWPPAGAGAGGAAAAPAVPGHQGFP